MAQPALTLHSVRARPVLLTLRRPVVARIATLTEWPLVLIDLRTEQGVTGRAYLEPYIAKSLRYLVPMLHDLGAELAGRAVAPAELFDAAQRSLHFVGYEGLSAIAAAGLDMAAWDALGQAAGLPLCRLLGGTPGPVPAYNSNALWLKPPEELGAEARDLVAEGGFGALKLRLGRERLADDLAALRAIRDAVGPELRLMADFNQGLGFAEALERGRALDGMGLDWIEEPLVYTDLDGHARLAQELATPIMLGENFYGPRALHRALAAGACDLVMPDLMRIGGITGWLRAAPLAAAAGVPVSSHLYPEVAAHLLRTTWNGHWLEWQDWADPVLQRPYPVRDGQVQVPDVPGLGLTWDEDAVAAHLVA